MPLIPILWVFDSQNNLCSFVVKRILIFLPLLVVTVCFFFFLYLEWKVTHCTYIISDIVLSLLLIVLLLLLLLSCYYSHSNSWQNQTKMCLCLSSFWRPLLVIAAAAAESWPHTGRGIPVRGGKSALLYKATCMHCLFLIFPLKNVSWTFPYLSSQSSMLWF